MPQNLKIIGKPVKFKHRENFLTLRHHEPNADKYQESYVHHLRFTFYPFRIEYI